MRLLDVYEGATGVLGFRAFGVRCFRFGESQGLGLFCSGLGGSNVEFRVSGFKASLGFEIVGNLGSGYLNPKHTGTMRAPLREPFEKSFWDPLGDPLRDPLDDPLRAPNKGTAIGVLVRYYEFTVG